MKIEEFEKELQAIDKDLSIRPNNAPERVLKMFPDVNNLASIIYRGSELCAIPNGDIYDEPNGSYGMDLRNDSRFVRHRTRPEALLVVKEKLERLKTDKEYADDFFGIGQSSDAALRSKTEAPTELVEEVSADVQEFGGEKQLKAPNV